MKKIYLSALALTVGLFAVAQVPVNPSFENAGFENWTTGAPDGWTDAATIIGGIATVTPATPTTQETTGATEGASYIRIETFTVSNSPNPAQLPNGIQGGATQQDFASTVKYSSISMDVAYAIQGSDNGMIYIQAKDAGGTSVALVNFDISGSQAALAPIDIPMTYSGIPATYSIIIASSEEAVFGTQPGVATAELGSWIAVDNIVLNAAGPDVPNVTNIVATDISNNHDGSDLKVTFDVPDETNIDSYYVIVMKTGYSLASLQNPAGFATGNGTLIAKTGANISHTFDAADKYWAINGAQTAFEDLDIVENVPFTVQVFVKAKTGFTSVYAGSNAITLTSGSVSLKENVLNTAVFPNPATNVVNFKVDGLENATVAITSVTGQEVINTSINGSTKVDVSSLNKGIYIYSIRNQEGNVVKTSKLVIQ